MIKINPSKVLFIKLGRGGEWEQECVTLSQTIRLGFGGAEEHQSSLNQQWDAVKEAYIKGGRSTIAASQFVNQIREFYEADETILWVTFFRKKLWWCFSKKEVTLLQDETKVRPVLGAWSDKDINGGLLTFDQLSGKLLKTQGYRGTLCTVELKEYVVSKINGEKLPEVVQAEKSIIELEQSIGHLIQHLECREFELLIDLIFSKCGWQRLGAVGKTEKTLDLDLLSPVTGERAMVQVKSESTKAEFESYCNDFNDTDVFDKLFFVVHTPDKGLREAARNTESKIKVLLLEEISALVVRAGLIDWIIKKTA